MAEHRTKKQKEAPHYNFLYSWQPKPQFQARVKREEVFAKSLTEPNQPRAKRADIQAKDEATGRIRKDIIKSLILISFVLALEVVVYLAWKKFFLS
jgi:hypothetical protein